MTEVCASIPERNGFRLEPWSEAWAGALVAAWNDPEIARWNPVPPDPTVELARSWTLGTASQNEASIGIDIVMIDDQTRAVAGEVGIQVDPQQGVGEVGFWLAADFRGRGLGTTLLLLAADLAAQIELVGIVALVDRGNTAAISLCKAVGWPEVPTTSERRAFAQRIA